jgi:ACS family glucarate transporter-like MFS transporter
LVGLCLAATIAYVQRSTLSVVEKEMRAELRMTTRDSALVMTTGFFITYALFQVPSGWLGHVWGSRRTLAVFNALGAALHAACYWVFSVPLFACVRGGVGLAQAPLFPCATGTIKSWFPGTRWGLANGLLTAAMQIGGAGGAIVVAELAKRWSWRAPFLIFAIPGFIWAVWFWIWFRDRPEDHRSVNEEERSLINGDGTREERTEVDLPECVPWRSLVGNRAMCFICLQQFFRAAAYIFYSSWFTTYLRDSRGVEIKEAGWLTSVPLWAYAAGSAMGGGFSDWLLVRTGSRRFSRQGLSILSQWVCAVLVLAAYPIQEPVSAVLILSAGAFCAAVGGPIAYAITIDLGGQHVRSVFALMNMWGNLGALGFPLFVAWMVGADPKPEDWDPVLPLFAVLYLLAGLAWLGFNPDLRILADVPEGFPEVPEQGRLQDSDLKSS